MQEALQKLRLPLHIKETRSSPVPELVEEVADEVLILETGKVLKHDSVANVCREAGAATLDEALRKLIFPETESELQEYFEAEVAA